MADIRQRYKPLDYTLYSATVPRDGEQVVVYNVPGYSASRRVIFMGDGVLNIAELVEAGAIGVQDAQIKTQNTSSTYTNQYAKLFSVELLDQGDFNDIRVSWSATGSGASAAEFCETLFRVEQVAAFGNDPVISAKTIGLGADLTKFSFWYIITQNTPTTVVDVYAQIEADNYQLFGYVLSATYPETTTFSLLADFEASITGEIEFSTGSVTASLVGDVTGNLTGTATTATGLTNATGLAPVYGARAWVDYDSTTPANQAATYSRTLTTVTVTLVGHGYLAGHYVYCDFITGGALDGLYIITGVPTADTFTLTTAASGTIAAGSTLNLNRSTIKASGNVHSVSHYANGQDVVNYLIAMPDANYVRYGSCFDNASNALFIANNTTALIKSTLACDVMTVQGTTGYNCDDVMVAFMR